MYSIDIDIKIMRQEIDKLKKVNIEMENLFNSVDRIMENMYDSWSGSAAVQTIEDYKTLSNKYNDIIEKNKEYIIFLEGTVNPAYDYVDKNINIEE